MGLYIHQQMVTQLRIKWACFRTDILNAPQSYRGPHFAYL